MTSPHSSVRPLRALRLVGASLVLAACAESPAPPRAVSGSEATATARPADAHEGTRAAPPPPEGRAAAVFAGGCFWCMEGPFEALEGVDEVVSGYAGGAEEHPTYHQVGAGGTGHVEAVRVVYDPTRVTYDALLRVFFHNIDPTQDDGQFCDRGTQYRSAVFVADDAERAAARAARDAAAHELDRPIVTEIRDAGTFWVAEDYHQDFHQTNPVRYLQYRRGCGRDARLRELWGDAAGH